MKLKENLLRERLLREKIRRDRRSSESTGGGKEQKIEGVEAVE